MDVCSALSSSSRLPRRYAPRNDRLQWTRESARSLMLTHLCHCERSVAISSACQRRCADVCLASSSSSRLPRRCAPRNDRLRRVRVGRGTFTRTHLCHCERSVAISSACQRRCADVCLASSSSSRLPRRCAPRNDRLRRVRVGWGTFTRTHLCHFERSVAIPSP